LLVIGAYHPAVNHAGILLDLLAPDWDGWTEPFVAGLAEAPYRRNRRSIDAKFAGFNETELLPALSRRWTDLAPPDWTLLTPGKRQNLALMARSLVERNFSTVHGLSILSDPRFGCLLPFWGNIVTDLGYALKIVCVVCSPHDVATSLQASLNISIDHGFLLYTSYWLTVLPMIRDCQHCLVSHQSLTADTIAELRRVGDWLSLSVPSSVEANHRLQVAEDALNRSGVDPDHTEPSIHAVSPSQANAQVIHTSLLERCTLALGDQHRDETDHSLLEWHLQSAALMLQYDKLHAEVERSREEILLLRAANQGYAESLRNASAL
jgi:hypothetical protein